MREEGEKKGAKSSLGDNTMRAASEVEQEERRRKPWMKIEVRGGPGGGGLLVLGGALVAAGLGAAFAAHRAHVNSKRRRSSMRPADERCKVEESLNEGISFDGQLDEVDGQAARGLTSLMTLDPIPLSPSLKPAESWQGEFSVHTTVEIQESTSMAAKIDQSPAFKNSEIVLAADAAECGDNVVQEFLLSNLDELKEEMPEFSFSGVEFTKIQDKNKQILEESGLADEKDREEKDVSEEAEALSPEELEGLSFRAVGSDTIRNPTKQTPEESRLSHDKEEKEEETESSTVEEESEREEEGSHGTGASSMNPAEAIEQEKDSSLRENHQGGTEESSKEKVTAVQAEQEIEEYEEKFAEEEQAVEEVQRNEMATGPERGLMAVNYSNRLLLLLALALTVGLIFFAHRDHLHHFHLAKLYHHLHHVFFPSNNAM